MLTMDLDKENFKRYTNGKSYCICVSTSESGSYISYSIFKLNDEDIYLPNINVETEDGLVFEILNSISISGREFYQIDNAINKLENYLTGYKIAKAAIEEFRKAIENKEI